MGYKCLLVAGLAIASMSPLSAQSVKAGIEAWQRSDHAGAVAIWRPLAEKGDADASFNLGQAYRLGRGVPINLGAAQTWFERAARKGHLDAQTTLGLLLFETGNRTGGLRWLRGAAEQGEPRALLLYGTALFNGDDVPRDPVLGYAYVSRAAAQGLGAAKQTLAELDGILPLEERKKGVALAIANSRAAPPPSTTMKKPAAPARATQKTAAAASAGPKLQVATNAGGAWRVQLGAFSRKGAAEALFARLARSGPLAGRAAFYIPAGSVTRLQAGPFASRAAAQAACNAIRPQACFPVPKS